MILCNILTIVLTPTCVWVFQLWGLTRAGSIFGIYPTCKRLMICCFDFSNPWRHSKPTKVRVTRCHIHILNTSVKGVCAAAARWLIPAFLFEAHQPQESHCCLCAGVCVMCRCVRYVLYLYPWRPSYRQWAVTLGPDGDVSVRRMTREGLQVSGLSVCWPWHLWEPLTQCTVVTKGALWYRYRQYVKNVISHLLLRSWFGFYDDSCWQSFIALYQVDNWNHLIFPSETNKAIKKQNTTSNNTVMCGLIEVCMHVSSM